MAHIHWFGLIGRKNRDRHKEAIETGSLLGRLESVTDRLDKLVEQLTIEVEKKQVKDPKNS